MITNTYTLGMHNLNYNGLDEVWLFKECGHIHWTMLSDIIPFNDGDGRYYASFFNIELQFQTDQSDFVENEIIEVQSDIYKFNQKIYRSIHSFKGCKLIMDSIFVKKTAAGLAKYEPLIDSREIKSIADINLTAHSDLKKEISKVFLNYDYMPLQYAPMSLFNNVKILYCANYLYLSMLSEYLHNKKVLNPIQSVNIHYFANIENDEDVLGNSNNLEIVLKSSGNKLLSHCKIVRKA